MRILFASSEAYPFVKTGGLADVSASLPRALAALGHDVVLLLPAYREALAVALPLGIRVLQITEQDGQGVRLLETQLPGSTVRVWLVDCPAFFDRAGNPYLDANGNPWGDNAARFALFCRIGASIARDACGLGWCPEVVHANDWQTALLPLLLDEDTPAPARVFTIHNLAYQGVFPEGEFRALGLPRRYWHPEFLEFHGQLCLIKAGIVCADRVTTVSPTYAREIRTPAFGCGLEGLLQHRAGVLHGILNGIDTDIWDPVRDAAISVPFDADTLAGKRANTAALRAGMGLAAQSDAPLLGFIGRLVEQKGIDLITAVLPALLREGAQCVLLGSGERHHEETLARLAAAHPGRVALRIGYDEALAHRITAGADIFLMPSRFEPCGLNQLYSLRYGTVPVVHAVGGLADTVEDASPAALAAGHATGFVFGEPSAAAFAAALRRAITLRRVDPAAWQAMQQTGMRREVSWHTSAEAYVALYGDALAAAHTRWHGGS